jgi:hypothetical protein
MPLNTYLYFLSTRKLSLYHIFGQIILGLFNLCILIKMFIFYKIILKLQSKFKTTINSAFVDTKIVKIGQELIS